MIHYQKKVAAAFLAILLIVCLLPISATSDANALCNTSIALTLTQESIEESMTLQKEALATSAVTTVAAKTTATKVTEKPKTTPKPDLLTYEYLNEKNLVDILAAHGFTMRDYNAVKEYTKSDITKISRTIYGEAGSNKIPEHEKAAVAWCIFNRIDNTQFGNSMSKVLTVGQFHGLESKNSSQFTKLAEDVCIRWTLEKLGIENVGRTLPLDYVYFSGRSGHNWFRIGYKDKKYWSWSLPSPYKTS